MGWTPFPQEIEWEDPPRQRWEEKSGAFFNRLYYTESDGAKQGKSKLSFHNEGIPNANFGIPRASGPGCGIE
jgi:hypothetical protein